MGCRLHCSTCDSRFAEEIDQPIPLTAAGRQATDILFRAVLGGTVYISAVSINDTGVNYSSQLQIGSVAVLSSRKDMVPGHRELT
jgi:hypothetical protein